MVRMGLIINLHLDENAEIHHELWEKTVGNAFSLIVLWDLKTKITNTVCFILSLKIIYSATQKEINTLFFTECKAGYSFTYAKWVLLQVKIKLNENF